VRRRTWDRALSTHRRARRDGLFRLEDHHLPQLSFGLLTGGEEHAIGLLSADGPRLQARNDNDLATHQGCGVVERADAGEDLSLLSAEVDLKLQEAIGVGVGFGGDDGGHAKVQLGEVLVRQEWFFFHPNPFLGSPLVGDGAPRLQWPHGICHARPRRTPPLPAATPAHPGRPPRHQVRRTLLVLLLAVCVMGGTFYVLTRPASFARLVAFALARKTGGQVQVDRATFSLRGPIVLEHVQVRVPGLPSPGDMAFSAERVQIQYQPWMLLLGRFRPLSVSFVQPVLYLTEDIQAQKYNLQYLLERKPPGRPSRHWPEVFLGAAQAVFGEIEGGEYRRLAAVYLTGSLMDKPEAHGEYSFTVVHHRPDGQQGALLSGTVNPRARTAFAKLERIDPDNPLFQFLPSRVRDWWARLKPSGHVPPIAFGYDPDPNRGFYATLSLNDFELSLPYGGSESRMTGVSGVFELGGEQIRVRSLRGHVENIDYLIDGVVNGFAADAAFAFHAMVSGAIPEEPGYIFAMPAQVQKQFYRFRPSGRFEAVLDIAVPQPGAELAFSGTVRLSNAKSLYAKFPYPLHDLSGEITFDNRQMRFANLRAVGPSGAQVRIDGTITPPADGAAVEVRVTARGVPLDGDLYAAMKPKHQAILDRFLCRTEYARLRSLGLVTDSEVAGTQAVGTSAATQAAPFVLGGEVDVDVEVRREAGPDSGYETTSRVQLRRVDALFEHWPYPLRAGSGELVIGPDRVDVSDVMLKGLSGAEIRLAGSVLLPDRETGQQLEPDLELVGRSVPVDALLLASVPAQQAKWLRDMRLQGQLDGRGRVFSDGGERVEFTIEAAIRDGTATPYGGQYGFTGVGGAFTLSRRQVLLKEIRARHENSLMTVSGQASWGGEGSSIDLKLQGDDLLFQDPVLDLMPPSHSALPALQSLFERYKPAGRFGLTLDLRQEGEGATEYALAIAPHELQLHLHEVLVELRQITGRLFATGERLAIENVEALFDSGRMAVSGALDTAGGAGEIGISAQADRISPAVRGWLPVGATRAIDALGVDGPFRLHDAKLRYRATEDLELGVEFQGSVDWLGAQAAVGTPITELRGTLQIQAESNGRQSVPRLDLRLQRASFRAGGRLVESLALQADNRIDSTRLLIGRLVGMCYGGTVSGQGVVTLADPNDYSFHLILQDAAYEPFIDPGNDAEWRAANRSPDDEPDVVRRRANSTTISAGLSVAGRPSDARMRRGRGELVIDDARLFRTPLALALLHIVNLNLPSSTAFDRAAASFSLQGDQVRIDRVSFQAPSVEIIGSGTMRYSDLALSLRLFSRNPAARLGVLSSLFNLVKDELLSIYVTGTLREPRTSVRALSGITTSLHRIFGPAGVPPAAPVVGAARGTGTDG